MSWYLIYKKTNFKKQKNKKICEEIFWYKFIEKCINIFESYDISRSFINWVWKNPEKPNISELGWVKRDYELLCGNFGIKPNFEPKERIIRKEYTEYLDYKNYTCKISRVPKKTKHDEYIYIMPKYDLSYRRMWGYKWTVKEEVYSTIKHHILHSITPGNQWTMLHNTHIAKFYKNGHNIEVFGSPFNTRLKYFGSLYKCDEPFGRVGTCWEILDKVETGEAVMWRKEIVVPPIIGKDLVSQKKNVFLEPARLIISPPSGTSLLKKLCYQVSKIVNIRPSEIYMGVPNYMDVYMNILKESNKIVSTMIQDKSWDFYAFLAYKNTDKYTKTINVKELFSTEKYSKSSIKGLTEINMKGREWTLVLLRS